jgi:FlaA1/EpsC-like NDP-sugar epimerase
MAMKAELTNVPASSTVLCVLLTSIIQVYKPLFSLPFITLALISFHSNIRSTIATLSRLPFNLASSGITATIMTKIIAVTGATGAQGGGVVNIMRKSPGWQIRAVTRNSESDAAKKLASDGIQVVQASFDDEASLVAAFQVRYNDSLPHSVVCIIQGFGNSNLVPGSSCRLRRNKLVGASIHRQVAG